MKPIRHLLCLCLPACLLLAGCSKAEKPDDAHAGHDHAGHAHAPASAPPAARCPHDAPKPLCFLCDPALRDANRLWCTEHSRYEDRCWLCHPELQDQTRPWCEAHSLYEDECFLCKPERKGPAAAASATVLMCVEHGVPELECGICRPESAATLKPGESLKVRLPSAGSAKLVGLESTPATVGDIRDAVSCYAELDFNQQQFAQLTAPVDGIVQEVLANVGDTVTEHQTVARLWSAGIADTIAQATLSHQTLERERKLRTEGVAPAKDLQEAEAAHRAACQAARTLGFSEADIDSLERDPEAAVLLGIRAPFAGDLVEGHPVRGARIEAGQALFTLANLQTMWAMLSIAETDLARVAVGQTVELQVDALPGETFTGTLTWIAASVDGRTRLAQARAEVPNPDRKLKARMFARARVLGTPKAQAVLIPAEAVSEVEGRPFVYIQQADDLYEARAVLLGASENGMREVRAGLRPGETVVVRHGFNVKSQLLASRLGAGCAHE